MAEKLVRDKILLRILEETGEAPAHRFLDNNEERLAFVLAKLVEEARELAEAETPERFIEELADLWQVETALVKLLGIDPDELERAMEKKRSEKGAFDTWTVIDFPQTLKEKQ